MVEKFAEFWSSRGWSANPPAVEELNVGAELVLHGAGFHATESVVSVCDKECSVNSVAPLQLKCEVPSLLVHASGIHTLNLTNATEAEYDMNYVGNPTTRIASKENVVDLS